MPNSQDAAEKHVLLQQLLNPHTLWTFDATTCQYLVRLGDPAVANQTHAFTVEQLTALDKRVSLALEHYREHDKLALCGPRLRHSYDIWENGQAAPLYNQETNYWERWRSIDYDVESRSYQITLFVNLGVWLTPELPLLMDSTAKLTLCLRDYELERLYPGFNAAYNLVTELGSDTHTCAVFCQRHVFGVKQTAPTLQLPSFEEQNGC